MKPNVEGVFSCDSVTLFELQKKAVANRKMTGLPYADALREVCRQHGFDDPALAARALYIKVNAKEIHRVLAGPVLLMLVAYDRDMYLNGCAAPEQPVYGYWRFGQVVYGDVTDLAEAKNDETRFGRPINKGWWLSKYSLNEPRIHLHGLTFEQVRFIADLLGFEMRGFNSLVQRVG